MALIVRKIAEIEELNAVLRGGVVGGIDLRKPIYGLDGLTMVFTTPGVTVTFATTPSSSQIALSAKEILEQINAVVGLEGFAKTGQGGKLFLVDPAAAAAVVLDSGTALPKLGFNDNSFATGLITAIAGASLVDGETFTLDDGVNPPVVFEFDDDVSVVETPTLRAVTFAGGDAVATVRDSIITAILGAPTLDITPSIGGPTRAALVNDTPGPAGNVAIVETVVDAGFIVSGMSGAATSASGTLYSAPGGGAPELVSVEQDALSGNTFLLTTDE